MQPHSICGAGCTELLVGAFCLFAVLVVPAAHRQAPAAAATAAAEPGGGSDLPVWTPAAAGCQHRCPDAVALWSGSVSTCSADDGEVRVMLEDFPSAFDGLASARGLGRPLPGTMISVGSKQSGGICSGSPCRALAETAAAAAEVQGVKHSDFERCTGTTTPPPPRGEEGGPDGAQSSGTLVERAPRMLCFHRGEVSVVPADPRPVGREAPSGPPSSKNVNNLKSRRAEAAG